MTFSTQSPEQAVVNPNVARFAFARIKGVTHLVQSSSCVVESPLKPVDVKIFQHEFSYIFRFSENSTVHPTDICFLETIDDQHAQQDEQDDEKVYLAKETIQRMQKYNRDPRMNRKYYQPSRTVMLTRQRQRQW